MLLKAFQSVIQTVRQEIKRIHHSRINIIAQVQQASTHQHIQHCTKGINVVSVSSRQPVTISEKAKMTNEFSPVSSFKWGERNETLFVDNLNKAYKKEVI